MIKINFAAEVFYRQMSTKLTRWILPILMLITETAVHAQTPPTEANSPVDTMVVSAMDSLPVKRGLFKKFLDYFNEANKEKQDKKFDFSVIGGPHYSSDTKLGIGLVAAGLYRTDRKDSILPLPMFLCMVMFLRLGSTCWGYVATTFFLETNTA